jgi:hypothetical protein
VRPPAPIALARAAGIGALALVLSGAAGPGREDARRATWVLDCAAPGREIRPEIYGIGSLGDEPPHVWELGATGRRWGGNASSRYNWEHGNAWSTSHDWFFRNVPVSARPGFGYEAFLEANRSHGVRTALTVPMLGWVAKDTASYSFPVSQLGPQQAVAPDLADSGNGLRSDGTRLPITPTRTSVRSTPDSVERWVRRIRERDRRLGVRRVHQYILDNEPMLWHETHRDVRSEPLTYDELLERTIAYASAIRRADPGATIAGPAAWGWLEYNYSAVDVAAGLDKRPDRLRHGDVPLLPWYLRQLRAYERRTGTRLLDVVDVHYYPALENVGLGTSGATDAATAALRIRSTRSLWDPDYVDESWIKERFRVIPRVREWIAESYPGLGLSIGEWNFGAEGHMSGGLAVAEVLGRFGTEGVTSAFYWTYPPDRSPAFWAFRAYRNFDGRGARFLDRSVPVRGEAPLASLFASTDAARRRAVLVLLNHDPESPLAARVDLSRCGTAGASRVFAYGGGSGGFVRAADAPAGATIEVAAAPYSITVVESPLAAPRGGSASPLRSSRVSR